MENKGLSDAWNHLLFPPDHCSFHKSIICTVAALCKALENLKFVDANRKSNSVCVFFRVYCQESKFDENWKPSANFGNKGRVNQ